MNNLNPCCHDPRSPDHPSPELADQWIALWHDRETAIPCATWLAQAARWITSVRPQAHHDDKGGEVVTQHHESISYAHWASVKIGEPWKPCPHLDHRPTTAPTSMSMITDRLPTADDGDADGDVCMKRRPDTHSDDVAMIHWSYVKPGTPWRHTQTWKPKRELPGVNGQWIRASAVKPVAADTDSAGDVQVYSIHSSPRWRRWDSVEGDVFWRPSTRKDERPLEAAGHRLPGFWGEFIRGSEALPTPEYADRVGDVVVQSSCQYKRWDCVTRYEYWRPWDAQDTRPRRSR